MSKLWAKLLAVTVGFAILVFISAKIGIFKLGSAQAEDCKNFANSKTITVSITDQFSPNQISAHVCDHLVFVANDDAGHWPAAGPHPEHDSYPGFDAGRPLKVGESYTIVLNRTGTYSFHDHLHEQETGEIIIDR